MQNRNYFFLLLAVLLTSLPVISQSTSSAIANSSLVDKPSTAIPQLVNEQNKAIVSKLDRLQTEIVLLKAQTALASAKGELNRASQDLSSDDQLPTLLTVFGQNRHLMATLQLSNRSTLNVKNGERILGGYRVIQIGLGEISLMRKGQVYRIGLSEANSGPLNNDSGQRRGNYPILPIN